MARDDFKDYPKSRRDQATRHFLISAGAAPLDQIPRVIRADGDGTITIEDELGNALPYTMSAGERLPFRGVKVTALTGGPFYGWV